MAVSAFTRRGFMAAAVAGLSLPTLSRGSAMAAPAGDAPLPRVIVALPQSTALCHSLENAGFAVTQRDAGAYLTDPACLDALKGQRVMLIGREADLVLFGLALGDHAPKATEIHRASHQAPNDLWAHPAAGWQAQTLSRVMALGLKQPHSEMMWNDAPRAFSTLIADL